MTKNLPQLDPETWVYGNAILECINILWVQKWENEQRTQRWGSEELLLV